MPVADPFEWLQHRVGREALPGEAFESAMKFALLWMYFEGQACGAEANSKRLREFATDLYARRLEALRRQLDRPLRFFSARYGDVANNPERFIRRLGEPERIKPADQAAIINALSRENIDEVDKATGLLLICFRVRNNLFHGSKQVQTLAQQTELFENLSLILTTLLEAREP
jgi:hypothetical protein